MVAVEIGLRLGGAFYVFAGFLVMRMVVMDRTMDQMLSALTLEAQPGSEAHKRWLWAISGMVITLGGAALMVLSLWALPLFSLGLATQVIYLGWARSALVPDGDDARKGRSQTINAAVVYAVVTIGVFAAAWSGLLRPWFDIWALAIPLAGIVLLGSVARSLFWQASKAKFGLRPDDEGFDDVYYSEPRPVPPLTRVRLQPRWGRYPFMDADSGEERLPDDYIPIDLANRIHQWSHSFAADDDSQTLFGQFDDEAHEAAHRQEGEDIVAELKIIFGDANASGPYYPDKICYGAPDSTQPITRVRIEPRQGRHAFVDADTGIDHPPEHHMPLELANRIHWWSMAFETEDREAPPIATFEDREDEAAHRKEGDAIVAELRGIFGDDNVAGPIYPSAIAYVGPGVDINGNRLRAPET
ncbi:hypothetical protein SAMN06295905_2135 [Devosia lucknowensis]|uniref:Uncharacterized protein n=1 Tax=Devosia lucknowensis TaxID=1096929 RepID=A0A1Y6FGY3_9HYPH|nr:hypothetical protein [Devosia lucknowensis]SMQ72841.1 hypothetical protein SAMN06295905_2135 [Devosia lucknowensis]